MSAALYDRLKTVTTGTITTMLLKKGIRRCWMQGPMPLEGARNNYPAGNGVRSAATYTRRAWR